MGSPAKRGPEIESPPERQILIDKYGPRCFHLAAHKFVIFTRVHSRHVRSKVLAAGQHYVRSNGGGAVFLFDTSTAVYEYPYLAICITNSWSYDVVYHYKSAVTLRRQFHSVSAVCVRSSPTSKIYTPSARTTRSRRKSNVARENVAS